MVPTTDALPTFMPSYKEMRGITPIGESTANQIMVDKFICASCGKAEGIYQEAKIILRIYDQNAEEYPPIFFATIPPRISATPQPKNAINANVISPMFKFYQIS